jgi:single-strand DNA-binding protein
MNFNKVILIGNLTRDPETRNTSSGTTVANFSLATNRVWVDQNKQRQTKAEFHNVVAWGRLADICSQYLQKGSLAMVEGRIETRSWQAPDGTKKYRTEIVAENIQLGPRNGAPATGFQKTESKGFNEPEQDEAPPPQEEQQVNLEDIPF